MRYYYNNTIENFLTQPFDNIWSKLTAIDHGDLLRTQKHAWFEQIRILKQQIDCFKGEVYFEYSIPRIGKRLDAILLINGVVFVVEFKVGAKEYSARDRKSVV